MGWGSSYSVDQGKEIGAMLARRHPDKPKKTMFTPTAMVAHVWAQQTQPYGRNGKGTLYFDGPAIYSYGSHFPIASFVEMKNGKRAITITAKNYSPTTSAHKNDLYAAIRNTELPIFVVPAVEQPLDHRRNWAYLLEAYRRNIEIADSHKHRPRNRLDAAQSVEAAHKKLADYRRAFLNGHKYRLPKLPRNLPLTINSLEWANAARQANPSQIMRAGSLQDKKRAIRNVVHYSSRANRLHKRWGVGEYIKLDATDLRRKYVRIREASAFINAGPARDYLETPHRLVTRQSGHNFAWHTNEEHQYTENDHWRTRGYHAFDQFASNFKTEAELTAEEREARAERTRRLAELLESDRAERLTLAEKVAAFRERGVVTNALHEVPCMLKVVGDTIKTSWGATFPAHDARRAWHLIDPIIARHATFVSNGHRIALGHFKIDRVDSDGTIHAGCHAVPYDEAKRCAAELGMEVRA